MDTTVDIKPIEVRLAWSPELDEIVSRLAAKAGQPKEQWLRRLLLDAIEDAEDYQIAEEAMQEFERDRRQSRTLEEVSGELGLDD